MYRHLYTEQFLCIYILYYILIFYLTFIFYLIYFPRFFSSNLSDIFLKILCNWDPAGNVPIQCTRLWPGGDHSDPNCYSGPVGNIVVVVVGVNIIVVVIGIFILILGFILILLLIFYFYYYINIEIFGGSEF